MAENLAQKLPSRTVQQDVVNQEVVDRSTLAERGRLQFFFHSPRSTLPVRDVTNEQGYGKKTEPFLEANAENYCSNCYQKNNIIPFINSDERYLFLQTTCRNPDLPMSGERFIVGYLEKEYILDMGSHMAVKGPISLFRFEDAYPGADLNCKTDKPRVYKLNTGETEAVLDHFAGREDVFQQCLEETLRLKDSIGRVPPEETDPRCNRDTGGC